MAKKKRTGKQRKVVRAKKRTAKRRTLSRRVSKPFKKSKAKKRTAKSKFNREELEANIFELLSQEQERQEQQEEDFKAKRIEELTREGREMFDYEEIDQEEVQEVRRWDIREYMNDLSEQGYSVSIDYGGNSVDTKPGTESELNADLFFTELEAEFFERFREVADEVGEDAAGSPDLVYKVILNNETNQASVTIDKGIFTHGGMIKGMPIGTIYRDNLL